MRIVLNAPDFNRAIGGFNSNHGHIWRDIDRLGQSRNRQREKHGGKKQETHRKTSLS